MIRHVPRRARLALAAAVLAASAGGAFAQAAPGVAPGAAPGPSASHLAVAREVAIASGLTRTFEAMLPRFGDQMRLQITTRPEVAKDLNEVLDAMKPELELQRQRMVNTTAAIFASRLTEAELNSVKAFFESPAGKRYVETQPLVLDDLVTAMQGWTQEVSEYVMVRARAELGKRGHILQ